MKYVFCANILYFPKCFDVETAIKIWIEAIEKDMLISR